MTYRFFSVLKHLQILTPRRKQGLGLIVSLTLVMGAFGCNTSMCPGESGLYGKWNKELICVHKEQLLRHGINIKWFHITKKEIKKLKAKGEEVVYQKRFERNYENGKLHGKYTEWYSDGSPKLSAYYYKGQINGMYTRWYSNGNIKIEARYIDGTRAGIYKEYYENGNIRLDYLYTATGQQDGNQTEYRMNGFKMHQRIYKMGKLIGNKVWRADGTQDPILKRF